MDFHSPDLEQHGPVPFWFWNDRLDSAEIRRQVRLMRDGGVRSFIIHARWGLRTPYLSAEWWRHVRTALGEAKACGMRVWLYDEYNYPSGIGGFKLTRQRRFRERYLATAGARTIASMRQDLMKGRRTEIDHMNGAVAALGERYGLPCPVNAALTTMIRFLEAGRA